MFYPPVHKTQIDISVDPSDASAMRSARTEVELMRYDIERLLMITEALWQILKEQHGYDDSELTNRITEIDRRDGRLDGRVAPQPPSSCPRCGRTLERKRPFCLFCGQMIAHDPFER
ncbi:MAG TPA: hypothetical protein PLE77_14185 [Kiritimatiellia bacterium]|nr:hypothetical protein [Kiritimatiellia bacterium]